MQTVSEADRQILEIMTQVEYGRIEVLKEAGKITVIKKTETILPKR